MRIKILSGAAEDLRQGYSFYESWSPGLGTYFLDTLFSDIDSLAYFGGIHRMVLGHHRMLSKRFPFAVYYRVVEDAVLILAVLDCRRDPGRTQERLTKA